MQRVSEAAASGIPATRADASVVMTVATVCAGAHAHGLRTAKGHAKQCTVYLMQTGLLVKAARADCSNPTIMLPQQQFVKAHSMATLV